MPDLTLRTRIAAPPSDCFALALTVEAHTASLDGSGERAVAGRTSGRLRLGETVTWRATHFRVPFRMTVAITAYDAPHRFVDEQVRGPFGHWHHEHLFEPLQAGGTLMSDVISFRSPLGPLGRAVDAAVLARYLERLVAQRNAWLRARLESDASDASGAG